MELIQAGEKTYYIPNATNIGVYQADETHVYLIDTGNDKDAGKKILKLTEERGWHIQGIINTHSNADHIGGNQVIQNRTGCPVLACGAEGAFTAFPVLEPSFLYGGYPFQGLRNKFLLAKSSVVTPLENRLPEGLEHFPLQGHFFDMIGIRTDDRVCFLADSLFSEETITKYHLFFLYDVGAFLRTLDELSSLRGRLFIPSHCAATADITPLIERNRSKVQEIAGVIYDACENGKTFEDILQYVFRTYGLTMNANQYVLVGSTVRSYLSYLCDDGRITYTFADNRMVWSQV